MKPVQLRYRLRFCATLTILFTATCGSGSLATQPTPRIDRSAGNPEETGLKVIQTRPDLSGTSVGAPSDDQNATVVVFFATWCEPCRKELQILQHVREKQPGVRIVGVNTFEEWEDLSDDRHLRAFLSVWAPWLRVVHGDPALVASFGGVKQIPAMFIFDRRGKLVRSFRKSERAMPSKAEVEGAVQLALRTAKQ